MVSIFLNLEAIADSESSVSLGVHSVKKLFMSNSMSVPIAPHTSLSPVEVVSSVTSRSVLNPKLEVTYVKLRVRILSKENSEEEKYHAFSGNLAHDLSPMIKSSQNGMHESLVIHSQQLRFPTTSLIGPQ